jgi:hypothetical protein
LHKYLNPGTNPETTLYPEVVCPKNISPCNMKLNSGNKGVR